MSQGPWKKIYVGSAGNLVEWFDWFVYASFATYFAGAFFPEGNDTAKLMNTAGIFAVGFFMRPVGGWLLGRVADRRGRKTALTLTVTLMSASAVLIAVAPTYAVAGYGGAAVLLIARLLQGLSVGGEYAASATYLTEASAPGRRGLASSFQYVSMTAGQILGLGILLTLQSTMSDEALHSWGWRIPFVVGALGAAVVFYLRREMLETEVYEQLDGPDGPDGPQTAAAENGTIRALLAHKREAFLVVALTMGGTVAYYTYTTYLTKYLSNSAGLPKQTATLVSFCALIVFACLQPLAGALSDRIGRRPLLITFALGSTFLTVPIMTLLKQAGSFWPAFGLSLLALVVITGYTSINACVKAELFPTGVRALGVALPYAVANALFGGTAEYVALWFKRSGAESGYYWYVAGCAAVSLVVYLTMRETRDIDLATVGKGHTAAPAPAPATTPAPGPAS
ncbi:MULTISPECIES: MFS transporter [Streptomyces]|uniref:Putative proline/betaine transporter n=1 Tax=Streptomyces tsukubensis (strain DSM 42081 / NBRC 108919 / NRRL 18488 / 9993) TaxID=1114943 RepID=I2N6X1_STRT9|nr:MULTISPECIES: MFS transporter [Streptomyces]AZK96710.1 MFS transporter [Streptomyces tsukubensis]EIF92768.1 transporter [Streptomyces tsukubensis NRRL18488]MYS63817.1 MFS transporter [Streptomyces sp. SID5473]QKM67297.1 MFS transporter [Streptomyces tsukubensis NRRL18488]TAI41998.1 MFS transporter [Streptomyces tsukubensis]